MTQEIISNLIFSIKKLVDLNKMGRREENNQGINPENADNYSFYENEKIIEIIEINKESKGETIEKNQS